MLQKITFIAPSHPTPRKQPPAGPGWRHEVKFDGWRIQLHKAGDDVALFSKTGHDFTDRFPEIAAAFVFFPARSAVIDAELTACDEDGIPDFGALLRGDAHFRCVWAFDLLRINEKDVRPLPYEERRARLSHLVEKAANNHIRHSDCFDDPRVLLEACKRMKLEGIVSKRIDRPYISGRTNSWIKVKCDAWREANQWRHEFFEKRR